MCCPADVRHRLLAAAVGLALVLTSLAVGNPTDRVDPSEHLSCAAPGDAPALDRMLLRASSPLAGEGRAFVRSGRAHDVDPRFLVAVAAHETLLETYAPAQAIKNPFGLGPGIAYPSERESVEAAAKILARGYLAEGRRDIAAIASKWAPIGAANDPTGLNAHWTAGVGRYYAALGGDAAGDIRLSAQPGRPPCAPPDSGGLDGSLIWVWDGRDSGPTRPDAFVFPLAARAEQPITYVAPDCGAGAPCPIDLLAAPGTPVVAAAEGTLRAATAAEQARGVGFWIEAGTDRFGYSPLADYAPGAREGARVSAGQVLGVPAEELSLSWQRDGADRDLHPLLDATRPATL